MRGVDAAFSQNKIQKQNLIKNFNLNSGTMISGHPNPPQLLSAKQKFNKKNILWCANFGIHKKPELFIKLAKALTDTDYKFIMIGSHYDKKYIDELFLDKPTNLDFVGKLDFFNTYKYFIESTIFINTSISDGEGFPNTFIQSWLSGTPTLSFDVDPNGIIHKYKLGVINKSFEKIIIMLKRYLSDYSFYEKISSNCLKYSKNHHSLEKMTDNFLHILNKKIILRCLNKNKTRLYLC